MSTELTLIDSIPEALREKILAASAAIEDNCTVSLNKIRLDAKAYIFPDGTETSVFTGIIVSYMHANIHYPKEYAEGVINPPDCFAVGKAPCDQLTPNDTVEARYSVACNSCQKFQWKSAARGNGKACAEHTLLAVYIPQLGEELYLLEEKKANSKVCDAYLNTAQKKFGHPIMVYTTFKMGEKEKWGQTFNAEDRTPQELVANLADRIDDADQMLTDRVKSMYQRNIHTEEIPFEETSREARSR